MQKLESKHYKNIVSGQEQATKSESSRSLLSENLNIRLSPKRKKQIEELTGENKGFYSQGSLIRHCIRRQLPEVRR